MFTRVMAGKLTLKPLVPTTAVAWTVNANPPSTQIQSPQKTNEMGSTRRFL